MNTSDILQLLLSSAVYTLPNMIVVLIGLIISISRYRKFPKVSRISIIAFSAFLLINIIGFFLPLLHFWIYRTYGSAETVGWITLAISLVVSILSASALGLLIYALWAERDNS